MKVIKSIENRGVLLKGTTRKVTSQEGGFLIIFFRPLMIVGLPLMKSVLTYISVLLPFGLSAVMSATDAAIPNNNNNNSWIRKYSNNNFRWRKEGHNENS